jgi:hypothetical protein
VGAALGLLAFVLAFTFQIARFGKVSHNFCLTLTRDFAQLRKVGPDLLMPEVLAPSLELFGGRAWENLATTGRSDRTALLGLLFSLRHKVCERRIFRTTPPLTLGGFS